MTPAVALALTALVVSLTALVLATVANRRWTRQQRTRPVPPEAAAAVVAPADPGAAAAVVAPAEPGVATGVPAAGSAQPWESAVGRLSDQVAALSSAVEGTGDRQALRHVAMVRYDAYADVGGRLSYSVAVLDDTVSGLVLTALAGKSDVRTYVRMISAGAADGSLTAEEQQAIEAAVGSEQ